MKRLSLFLAMLFLTAWTTLLAQRNISGKVIDEAGEPLIGASVQVKGLTVGTVTDVDGAFAIEVPTGHDVLVVTYTGYATKEANLGSNVGEITITMVESAEQLSEILVTAIGIQREKKALGYSVTDLSGDQLAQRSEPDAIRAIAGKTPGVQVTGGGGAPGQTTKINIRGNSSLTGNTQPLFVVDGIPFDNSVNSPNNFGADKGSSYSNRAFDIDPNNIQSMTILKGAAAAALYGSRATNGVVVITTKTGGKNARKGLEVSYSSSYSTEKISGLPDYQNVYSQGSNQNYNGGFIGNWGAPFPTEVDRLNATYGTNYSKVIEPGYPEGTIAHPLASTGYSRPRFTAFFPELWEKDGSGNPIILADGLPKAIAVPFRPYDFVEKFFEQGTVLENSLTINAGGKESSLSATVSRMDNDGIVPNSKANRTSLSFGGNGKLANGLVLSGNVTYVNTGQANPPLAASVFGGNNGTASDGSIYTRLFFLPRNFDLFGENGVAPYPFETPFGDNVFYRALDNPLWLVKYNKYSSDVNRAFGNLTLSYDVTPWLNLTAKGGMNTYGDARKSIEAPGGVADPTGEVWTDDIHNTEIDFNYLATVNRQISKDIDFKIIGGVNLNQRSYSERFVDGRGVIAKGLYNTDKTISQSSYEETSLRRFYSAYGDATIGYKNYLYLGLVARNDWSSTLPKKNQSFLYGGANMSLIFTDMLKMNSNILGYGKIRAAYTSVGNEASPYRTRTTYSINQPFVNIGGTSVNRASLGNTLGNADLRHELTHEVELGTDLRFFNNKIGVEFTWFKRNSSDQITTAELPRSTGFVQAIVNAGEIENKGIELGVDLTPIKTKSGFEWNTFVNFTRIRSLVVDAGPTGQITFGSFPAYGTLQNIHRTGYPYAQIFGAKNARTPEGDLLIDKDLGTTIVLPTNEIVGDPNPDFMMGINNSFSFKGFTLRALIDWRQGGDMFLTTAGSLTLRGQLKVTEDREPLRIIPGVYGDPSTYEAIKGDDGKYIRNTTPITSFDFFFSNGFGPYGADETNVYDITNIRLREVSLGYDLPKKLLKKTPIGSARISISGRNLWWYAPNLIEGINSDPEVLAENADTNLQGIETGTTPTTKRFGVNLNVTF